MRTKYWVTPTPPRGAGLTELEHSFFHSIPDPLICYTIEYCLHYFCNPCSFAHLIDALEGRGVVFKGSGYERPNKALCKLDCLVFLLSRANHHL